MKISVLLTSVLLTVTLALAGCAAPGAPASSEPPETAGTSNETLPGAPALTELETLLEEIYSRVNPSVVNISVVESQIPGFPLPRRAEGSGFVWDTEGNIVTNRHVIADAGKITVTFYDGSIVPGIVVGADADSDLAVVRVDVPPDQLKPVEVADSSMARVGQLAVAIGNPFGLQGTMTVGFISGLGRLIPADENALGATYSIPDIIQTDAPINPGNSGGVLLDSSGKLIGVTQSIATESGTSSGVGFAIPSAIVQKVVPALVASGRYDHPYLGISITSLDPDLAAAMNLAASQRGALVITVTDGSPAARAGIRASEGEVTIDSQPVAIGGDVIIRYDDIVVRSSDDLVTFLARYGSAGQVVTLTVLRGGVEVEVPVTIGIRPGS
ncbi:MAG: PDZ domain-containing protein [Dehalococcoidia bacterium]|jgi:2-alkenal reductase|nr:MAG: PDZ domain-containing protein [Dehalococcoidia bacterium]